MKNDGHGFPFQLKKPKTAKVSAISESTASSTVDPSIKVNFHIGNPLQDIQLSNLYYKLCTGNYYGKQKKSKFSSFLFNTVLSAVPYSPRSGFIKGQPNNLITKLDTWLCSQEERLEYALQRGECIFFSGGIYEFLRVLFKTLDRYMIDKSYRFITFGLDVPEYIYNKTLNLTSVQNEQQLLKKTEHNIPLVLLINEKLSDQTRRALRKKAEKQAILFCELSGCENHSSLARESGLQEQVIRFIPAGIMGIQCQNVSIDFVLGQSDFLQLLSNVQFELKGTPSATEIKLLDFLSDKNSEPGHENIEEKTVQKDSLYKYFNHLETLAENKLKTFENLSQNISQNFLIPALAKETSLYNKYLKDIVTYSDSLENTDPEPLFNTLVADRELNENLESSFLNHFIRHNRFYNKENCLVVSGSSRTGLSILGQFLTEKTFFTFDQSWSYEHAFSNIHYIALNDFESSFNELFAKVKQFIKENSQAPVVILNNPHNASGSVFPENIFKELITNLLQNDVLIIDDLCYKDVSALHIDKPMPTIKEIASELYDLGYISALSLEKIITAHSLSKTDCFAGARLAVFEINHIELKEKMQQALSHVKSNTMALYLAYLFYRNDKSSLDNYYYQRNKIFRERAAALLKVIREIPPERNAYEIDIKIPDGSMYPRLKIKKLPYGISLDQLADKLALNGIGLIPMSTFAKTAAGLKKTRNSFRLTLGGSDNSNQLEFKTRNLVIELNRMLREEQRLYELKTYEKIQEVNIFTKEANSFQQHIDNIKAQCKKSIKSFCKQRNIPEQENIFLNEYLPDRLDIISKHFRERSTIYSNLLHKYHNGQLKIEALLQKEFFKDNITERRQRFKKRLFDRTVHPTQMYSVQVDFLFKDIVEKTLFNKPVSEKLYKNISKELFSEFFGENVPVNSEQEASELVFDLNAMIECEWIDAILNDEYEPFMLSFWSDWDGSTRPSGQGHRLIAAVVIENVRQMADILKYLAGSDSNLNIASSLIKEIQKLDSVIEDFWELLNKITRLTNQLEKRYQGIYEVSQPAKGKVLSSLRIKKDPIKKLSQHNDNLEKRMLKLREKRSQKLDYYFSLNKQLRKELYRLIPEIIKNTHNQNLLLSCLKYRNLLNRFTVTPRIHQKMITAADSFAVETTVKNLLEINDVGALYGNPGVVLALQISMSNDPQSLIKLDRLIEKIAHSKFEDTDNFHLWLIPLFEDQKTIDSVINYLDTIYSYAENTYAIDKSPQQRMSQIMCEVFIAGSDLSQQVGAAKSSYLYRRTKATFYKWLADKELIDAIRIKLGSGETAQRQNGHVRSYSGLAMLDQKESPLNGLNDLVVSGLQYAITPLSGLHASGDLRTIQSTASEKIFRFLPAHKRYELFKHIKNYQFSIGKEIMRIASLGSSRLDMTKQIEKEFKRVSQLSEHPIIDLFLESSSENFRRIVYGEDNDIFGIHVASYFISRMLPVLRDRPIVRPPRDLGLQAGQRIVERLAQTLPLSKYGSLLRAIGHNQAQTMVLGIDQLSCGIFRSIKLLRNEKSINDSDLPHLLSQLPVYEILNNLRIYYDHELFFFNQIAKAFNPGNKTLKALYEDRDSMREYIPFLQKELIRRHGLNPEDYFNNDTFKQSLLHLIRPDLAVLLQKDIFNRDADLLISFSKENSSFWIEEINKIINVPVKVNHYRNQIWSFIKSKVFQQISSFSDLAVALTALEEKVPETGFNQFFSDHRRFAVNPQKGDSMQLFLISVMDFLSKIPRKDFQVPIDVLRTISDIKRIIKIDEQALSDNEQNLLRYNLIQMARVAGENG